jgi:hypothetical protein
MMEHHEKAPSWKDYQPLIIILVFCLLLTVARQAYYMYSFMGYFLVFLSLFKFFDLQGFVKGFATYDLITKKFQAYGYAYPFIELFLGLAYLAHFHVFYINLLTIIVMSIGAAGVIKSIASGQKIHCACLGTVLKVPLSTVSIVENMGMALMALFMLLF